MKKKVGHKVSKIENEAERELTRKEQLAFSEVRGDFKKADLTKIDARYSYAKRAGIYGKGGEIIEMKFRNRDKWYPLKTQSAGDTDKTLNQSYPPNLKKLLRGQPLKDAVDEEIDKTNAALQDLQKQEEAQRKALQQA